MRNPYEVLGIPKDASPEDITRAYRAASRKAHPDMPGGSTAAMQELNAAYAILSDPEKRAHFDATGSAEETTDPATNAVMNIFRQLLAEIESNDAFAELDLAREIVNRLNKALLGGLSEQNDIKRRLTRLRKMEKKFSRKDNKKNFYEAILSQRILILTGEHRQLGEQLEHVSKAIDLAKEFSFEHDKASASSYAQLRQLAAQQAEQKGGIDF